MDESANQRNSEKSQADGRCHTGGELLPEELLSDLNKHLLSPFLSHLEPLWLLRTVFLTEVSLF
jgi:hypothetical protein